MDLHARHVATLIADTARLKLAAPLFDAVERTMAAHHAFPVARQWLAEVEACDIVFEGGQPEAVEAICRAVLGDAAVDIIVQPAEGRRKKLLVADMESTVITVECLDELAKFVGLKDEIAAITDRAMNGELDFEHALRERVALLAGLPEQKLDEVYRERVRPMPGARELVATMKAYGAHCMLVSGGFDFFTSRVRALLGFDEDRSNRLEISDGLLTGRVLSPILGKEAKLEALIEAAEQLKLSAADALAIGDGANDLPMLLHAGLGLAYRAKPRVQQAARWRINHGDLTSALYAQGYKKEDWVVAESGDRESREKDYSNSLRLKTDSSV